MQEEGTVVSIHGNTASLEMADAHACRGCGACARIGGRMVLDVPIDPESPVSPGDRVLVEIPAEPSFAAAALLYVVPLAGFLLGALAGSLTAGALELGSAWTNALPILLAVLGLVGGFCLAAWLDRHRRRGVCSPMRILHRL